MLKQKKACSEFVSSLKSVLVRVKLMKSPEVSKLLQSIIEKGEKVSFKISKSGKTALVKHNSHTEILKKDKVGSYRLMQTIRNLGADAANESANYLPSQYNTMRRSLQDSFGIERTQFGQEYLRKTGLIKKGVPQIQVTHRFKGFIGPYPTNESARIIETAQKGDLSFFGEVLHTDGYGKNIINYMDKGKLYRQVSGNLSPARPLNGRNVFPDNQYTSLSNIGRYSHELPAIRTVNALPL